MPFVLYGDIEKYDRQLCGSRDESHLRKKEQKRESTLQIRYLEVFEDVEKLIEDTILPDQLQGDPHHVARSRLRQLVPTVGNFFTKLPLREAFLIEDKKVLIS